LTPLHWAAYYGRLDVVRLLLERGADKEAKNNVRTAARMHGLAVAQRR